MTRIFQLPTKSSPQATDEIEIQEINDGNAYKVTAGSLVDASNVAKTFIGDVGSATPQAGVNNITFSGGTGLTFTASGQSLSLNIDSGGLVTSMFAPSAVTADKLAVMSSDIKFNDTFGLKWSTNSRIYYGGAVSTRLNLDSTNNNGEVAINATSGTGVTGISALFQSPSVRLYANGLEKFNTHASGASIIGDLIFYPSGSNNISHQITQVSGTSVIWSSRINSAEMVISGFDTTGTEKTLLSGQPDNSVKLFYNGNEKIRTDLFGIRVTGNIDVYSSPSNLVHQFTYISGGEARWSGRDTNMKMIISSYNSANTDVKLLEANPNGATTLYHSNGFSSYNTRSDGSVMNGRVHIYDGVTSELNYLFENSSSISKNLMVYSLGSSKYFSIQGQGSGTFKKMFTAFPDGSAYLYHNNTERLQTTSSGVSVVGDLNVSGSITGGNIITASYPISPSTLITINHNLGTAYVDVVPYLICVAADGEYSPGDVVHLNKDFNGNASLASLGAGHSITSDTTNVYIRFGNYSNVYEIINKTTGSKLVITPSKWNIKFKISAV